MASYAALAIRVKGQVQGVGFRPFIWQIAKELECLGEVLNDNHGVLIKLLCPVDADAFIEVMQQRLPPLAAIDEIAVSEAYFSTLPTDFLITASQAGVTNTRVAPDSATCDACLTELFDTTDRRYQYPFINCTHCGPRFSIIKSVPYDRKATTMAPFALCDDCQQEYQHPANRRFHAQPNACPECGPKLQFVDSGGSVTAEEDEALTAAAQALAQGRIVAIKALGGFHLAVDASNAQAVERLRERKQRPSKPFALMVANAAQACNLAQVNTAQEDALTSQAAPIVLLTARQRSGLAPGVAPGQHRVGVMLPSNPLQHCLLSRLNTPLVMTSGNASGRPPCITNEQALKELADIADDWLLHNRDINNRVDDSIVQHNGERVQVIRRARGYVPTPISLPSGFEAANGVLAFGADLKNTFCLLKDGAALLSPHLGDLADADLFNSYQENIGYFSQLYDFTAQLGCCDAHPGYLSHAFAQKHGYPVEAIQHHHAHLAACLVDNDKALNHEPVFALVLDGIGWGDDSSEHDFWGAEILFGNYHQCQRLGGLSPMPLLGGDKAAKEPWRNLLVYLDVYVENWEQSSSSLPISLLQTKPLTLLRSALTSKINCPQSSSCGRLFDAAAALLTDCFEWQSFEGEAAMALESLAWQALPSAAELKLELELEFDQRLAMKRLWQALVGCSSSKAERALGFHRNLANLLLGMLLDKAGDRRGDVVLSGGVMQNRLLHELLVSGASQLGFNVLVHSDIPANDGGLAVGQAVIAWANVSTEVQTSASEYNHD
ncbi:carbamoyltransferase HypF [Paraferrimonas haliotis]|uniref:Carbamoyltransferase HypF n=1 Tax=Paraferrimonas haliotis TaxID=2013866 RepID=A0AA37TUA0_9GAMM|nr:carbamoyltransferase HypF [Paraferrimonas haliotis]GLS82810.1 carbamoyltransferase HypF [Paraferrimonas haliotis]